MAAPSRGAKIFLVGFYPTSKKMLCGNNVMSMKIKQQTKLPFADMILGLAPEAKNHRDRKRDLVDRIKISLVTVFGISLLMTLPGCIGWVGGGGGYYGDGGWWGEWWGGGGGYDRGRDVRGYSARGAASRGAAHGGGGFHGGGGRR